MQLTGLTQAEVLQRRANGQGNNAKLPTSRSYAQIFQENLLTFINFVFFTLSLLMFSLKRYGDAFLVVIIISTGIVISIVQEIWAKRKLDAIALLSRPKASVMRDGQEQEIRPEEIVLGDLLLLRSGDQILVDGVVTGPGRVEIDESLLTGESDVVPKSAGDQVYSGTICVSGMVYFEATKVGAETVAYKLVTGARTFRQTYTPLQKEINFIIRSLLLLSCFLLLLVGISFFSRSYSFADIVQHAAVVAGLVPTGLLIAITLAYGTAAVRMLGQDILIQQTNAVESLSNVNVLCLDKTGTLTTIRLISKKLSRSASPRTNYTVIWATMPSRLPAPIAPLKPWCNPVQGIFKPCWPKCPFRRAASGARSPLTLAATFWAHLKCFPMRCISPMRWLIVFKPG
jgi:cation-transporting P-type ATPase E